MNDTLSRVLNQIKPLYKEVMEIARTRQNELLSMKLGAWPR